MATLLAICQWVPGSPSALGWMAAAGRRKPDVPLVTRCLSLHHLIVALNLNPPEFHNWDSSSNLQKKYTSYYIYTHTYSTSFFRVSYPLCWLFSVVFPLSERFRKLQYARLFSSNCQRSGPRCEETAVLGIFCMVSWRGHGLAHGYTRKAIPNHTWHWN